MIDYMKRMCRNGWLQDPLEKNSSVLFELNWLVEEIKTQADTLIVIGVGGSYNGTKALEQALSPYFKRSDIEIIYAGNQLSGAYMEQFLHYIQHKNPYVYVVSKSGTTLETSLTFRLLTEFMQTKFGQNYCERIISNGLVNKNMGRIARAPRPGRAVQGRRAERVDHPPHIGDARLHLGADLVQQRPGRRPGRRTPRGQAGLEPDGGQRGSETVVQVAPKPAPLGLPGRHHRRPGPDQVFVQADGLDRRPDLLDQLTDQRQVGGVQRVVRPGPTPAAGRRSRRDG